MKGFKKSSLLALAGVAILLTISPSDSISESRSSTANLQSLSTMRPLVRERMMEREREGSREKDVSYLESWYDYVSIRAYPYDTVDWTTIQREADRFDKLAAAERAETGIQANIWTHDGPDNMGSGGGAYFGPNPVAGRVSAIAYTNDGANVYVGSPSGGVWKTTSAPGNGWEWLSKDWTFQAVSCIAIKPGDSNVVLVGTGDYAGYVPLGACGIKRSVNGGETWDDVIDPFGRGRCVSSIVFDPENPNVVLACTGRGQAIDGNRRPTGRGKIFRSTDSGASWSPVAGPPEAIWSSLAYGALSPTTGRRLYYATCISPKGELWRSADLGRTWEKLPTNLADREYDCVKVACSPTEPGQVYLMSGITLVNPKRRAIWRSSTGGKPVGSWQALNIGLFDSDDAWDQCYYDDYIACASRRDGTTNKDILFVGLKDLFVSLYANTPTVGDVTFRSAPETTTARAKIHYDQQCIAFRPGDFREGFVGCDGGLYKMAADYAAPTFDFDSSFNEILHIAEIYRADWRAAGAEESVANRIAAGLQDNQTVFNNGGFSWPNACNTGDGHGVAILGVAPRGGAVGDIQCASGYASGRSITFIRTTNRWGASTSKNVPLVNGRTEQFFPPIAVALAADEMYAGSSYLHRSIDDGAWTELGLKNPRGGADKPLAAKGLTALAVAPTDNKIIYAGGFEGELYRSTNKGANDTWKSISAGLPARPITHIAVDPTNAKRIVVTLGGNTDMKFKVWKCDDTTARAPAWTEITGSEDDALCLPNVQANCVAIDPDVPATHMYVGTDIGFFYTRDGGRTWRDGTRNLGLPRVQVNSVKVLGHFGTSRIYVATYGRGTWYTQYYQLP